jgi:hypothetical protein
MSTGAPSAYSLAGSSAALVFGEAADVGLDVNIASISGGSDVWQQVEELLRGRPAAPRFAPSLVRAPLPDNRALHVVAPGVAVSSPEFDERFADLPLDDYRSRMSPAVFEAFVRYVGIVPGSPDFDPVGSAEIPSD